MMERAREGWDYERVRAHGLEVLGVEDVLPGVPALARGLACEPLFGDGPRVIVLANPIGGSDDESAPGARRLADEPILINAGREVTTITVTNGSDRPVNVSSHFHFYEINPRMEFDRRAAYGKHLDIQAGRSVIWRPGEARVVDLVPFAGAQITDGFQLAAPPTP
jgi:urease subunit gamma/beta